MLQKIFILTSILVTFHVSQRGKEVKEIKEVETVKVSKNCSDWEIKTKRKVARICDNRKECTFFFLQYNIITGNEWFGDFRVESKRDINKTFSKFELRVLYDNLVEKKIYELPKIVPSVSGFYKGNEVINFSVDKKYKNLSLGVWGPDTCGGLELIRLYYYECPTKTGALVEFAATPAPSLPLSPISLKGKCAQNAIQNESYSPLSMKCYYNGTYEVFGSCVCKAGFSNFFDGTHNKECKG